MIRQCQEEEFEQIWSIINEAAQAYKGAIPADCWAEPYMSRARLEDEIAAGVAFWGAEEGGSLAAVMGLQQVEDVTLIRHAYVRSGSQKRGLGSQLLAHLRTLTSDPILIGTWAGAVWAVRFYEKHGFVIVGTEEKVRLLRRYWTVAERQIETSLVLTDSRWQARRAVASPLIKAP